MKKLIKKELTLCLNPQVVIFTLLSATVAIPGWPALIGFIYPLSGLSTIFPRGLADQDITYTAMLPIRKGDVVKAKVWLVILLELASLVIAVPFALLKIFYLTPATAGSEGVSDYDLMVAPSLMTFGFAFLALGVYNLVLFPWYYHNPQKVNWPPVVALTAAVLILGAGTGIEALMFFLSQGQIFIAGTASYWGFQSGVLGVGIILFVFLSWLAEHLAEKAFKKVDL